MSGSQILFIGLYFLIAGLILKDVSSKYLYLRHPLSIIGVKLSIFIGAVFTHTGLFIVAFLN